MPKLRYPVIEFDKLQMYFMQPYVIDLENAQGSITIYQPTIGDIVKMGEKKFYSTLNIFVANTTMYRSFLWDMGKDWNTMSDFELWLMLLSGADEDVMKLLFHDIDLRKFKLYPRVIEDKEEFYLYSEEYDIEITEDVYQHIHQYIQEMFSMKPEEKITTDMIMKKWYIQKDKRQAKIKEEKNDSSSSSMINLISGCVNHPGFKYKPSELMEVGVYQFYDSVKRLQVYENTTAVQHGLYAGLALGGSKNIKPDDYNFMREI